MQLSKTIRSKEKILYVSLKGVHTPHTIGRNRHRNNLRLGSYEPRYRERSPTLSLRTATEFLVEQTGKVPHRPHTIVLQALHGRRDSLAI